MGDTPVMSSTVLLSRGTSSSRDLPYMAKVSDVCSLILLSTASMIGDTSYVLILVNYLTPNDHYMGRTAQLTSRCCILYIYSTNIRTEYFKHAA